MVYVFTNPETGKEWKFEIEGNILKTYSKYRTYEKTCESEEEATIKIQKEIKSHLRKGFVYTNPSAQWGDIRARFHVPGMYTGFMPLITRKDRDDFYLICIERDDVEYLYHFTENGTLLRKYPLGKDRFSYRAVWNKNDTIFLDNDYQIDCFLPDRDQIEIVTPTQNFLQSMLDARGDYTLWFTGKELVVYNLLKEECVWKKEIVCQENDSVDHDYYHMAFFSETGNLFAYRIEAAGYHVVNLVSAKEIFIEDSGDYSFFSPDDCYINIGGRTYSTHDGSNVFNPFRFAIRRDVSRFDRYHVLVRGALMAVRFDHRREFSIQIREYGNPQPLGTVENFFAVTNYNLAFTKNNLVVYSDLGIITVYHYPEGKMAEHK